MTPPDRLEIDNALANALVQGAPATSVADILLSATGQSRPPVDLSTIVKLWPGLSVTVEDLDGDGYMIELGGRSGEILVKRATMRTRRRFTLAHELGHWTLTLWKEGTAKMSRAQVEKWCDEFATELLIPRSWLAASLVSSRRSLATVVSELPAVYEVSNQPMWIQCSHQGFLSLVIAGRRVEEYPAAGAHPSERSALVHATVDYRDRRAIAPLELTIGEKEGVVFKASRTLTMGVLTHTRTAAP